MVLTENEAKTKLCPFATTGAYTDRGPMMAVAVNRDPRPDVQSANNCLGSACMGWSWIYPSVNKGMCGLKYHSGGEF